MRRAFDIRLVALAPGEALPFDQAQWRDALVTVEQGEVELEACDGTRWHFARGAVLCLDGMGVVAVHNPRQEPAVLAAASRRRPPPVAREPRSDQEDVR